jgi:hypothetical protein
MNYSFFHSAVHFLVNEYKVNPETFIYDWTYDTSDKNSLMSKVYIDLGNYLSSKDHFDGTEELTL